MNRKDADCVVVSKGKYAHKLCFEKESTRELTDKEKLHKYIMELFDIAYVSPRILKQIDSFISNYNYTYSGIQKSLEYFYEIKGNSLDNSNNGIGIVPYIYNEAFEYFYALWQAKTQNQYKDIKLYVPKEKVIVIMPPERHLKKRQLFTFLDEEGDENE